MKYKVGDKVLIKDIDWYHENKNKYGRIYLPFDPKPFYRCQNDYVCFSPSMAIECGTVMTIDFITNGLYMMKGSRYGWTDDMIERLATESEKESLVADKFLSQEINKAMREYEERKERNKQLYAGDSWSTEFECPNGYIFKDENGNVINATKIVLDKKKNEYPKTYKECCKVLNLPVRDLDILDNMLDTTEIIYNKNLDRLLNSFRKLLICRDAYWKLYGEEMGLGKPWEPDWSDCGNTKYTIRGNGGEIDKGQNLNIHITFAFPTEEMRDAFYENFKKDIEFVKELL